MMVKACEPGSVPLGDAGLVLNHAPPVFVLVYSVMPAIFIFAPIVLLYSRYWWLAVIGVSLYVKFSFDGSEHLTVRVNRHLLDLPILRPIWRYFQSSLNSEVQLDSTKQYVFGVHPHGNLAFNRALLCFDRDRLWNKVFPGIETRYVHITAFF